MSVESIKPRINPNFNGKNNSNARKNAPHANSNIAFQGGFKAPNPIVGLMDFIAAGGFAASFCIQDGLGFIAPRVGKGLFRGGKEKKDSNGNVILDKNGNPKHELNWAYARKEGIREVITGPSAFIIPWFLLKGINKYFGSANSVKLNYIDAFNNKFENFAKNNLDKIKDGTAKASKEEFYQSVFEDVLESSINKNPKAVKLSEDEIKTIAKDYAGRQVKIEEILENKDLKKAERNAELAKYGSIEDDFMALKKAKIGGSVSEMEVELTSSNNRKKVSGSIGELTKAMKHYYSDAVDSAKKALEKNANADISELIQKFTKRRMGSRILTNIGLFLTVAAFYTQIPKLYNMGLKSNPALANSNPEPALQNNAQTKSETKKDVTFEGNRVNLLERTGEMVFNSKNLKSVSDIFELNGPIIQGNAMSVLLYGACIPPRLAHAQDKYDYGEIIVRDLTAFTALLFGAKALSRLFSDGLTKLTGLALNKKDLEGRSIFQKIIDYLNPADTRHSVLSSKQLDSKYTNIDLYKNGVIGFMEFIEESGGNIKKAFAQDKKVKTIIEKILGKSYDSAGVEDIKSALKNAHASDTNEIKEFYKLFKKPNGLLNRAKTCNSAFGALSTLLLVPGLIYWLTDFCKKMTDKRQAKENAQKTMTTNQALRAPINPTYPPTMAGFLNKN